MRAAGEESGRPRFDCSCLPQGISQPEFLQDFYTTPADEFTTDAMARIMAGLNDCDGDALLPQTNTERQPGQAATHNGDWSRRAHGLRFATNKWLNSPLASSIRLQRSDVPDGQSADNSLPAKPAPTLTAAS